MWQSLQRSAGWMILGGLLVGCGVAIGLWASQGDGADNWAKRFPDLPHRVLQASTASSGESFAMATGVIDQDAEGVFVLDFLTGNLRCAVLNNRTGKFTALFQANVARDLGVTKNPKYQMVTGAVNFQRGSGIVRPALSAVYVLDSNSGRMMAYGIPWQREASVTMRPQIGSLIPYDAMQVRTVQVREQ